jgi:hypothetical protein
MELEIKHLLAILSSPELRQKIMLSLSDPACASIPLHKLSEDQYADLYNTAWNAWRNDSPVVVELSAEQDKGVYSINIHGVTGAYFVTAIEYDNQGPFDSLEDARGFIDGEWGEFLVRGEDSEPEIWYPADDEFQRLKKKRIWEPWQFLVSGEWSETPVNQGSHTFDYSLSKDGAYMRILHRGFPSEILAIASVGKDSDLGSIASSMLDGIRVRFYHWIEIVHSCGDLDLDI